MQGIRQIPRKGRNLKHSGSGDLLANVLKVPLRYISLLVFCLVANTCNEKIPDFRDV